jgi:hypothetical protein
MAPNLKGTLYAGATVTDVATYAAVFGSIGAAGGVLIGAVSKFLSDQRKQKHEEHKENTDQNAKVEGIVATELRELVDRQDSYIKECRLEIHDLRNQLTSALGDKTKLSAELAAVTEKVYSLQDLLGSNNIPFRPWGPWKDSQDLATTQGSKSDN